MPDTTKEVRSVEATKMKILEQETVKFWTSVPCERARKVVLAAGVILQDA